jgi:hypothetical protein
MTLAPRFLVNLWAGFRVTRLARRLRRPGNDAAGQRAAFAAAMQQSASTEFGREHGLAADTPYARFRDAVPLRTHAYFDARIARMAAGESDVLVPGRCRLFVETAGTTGLAPRLLPVPDAMLRHYRAGLRDALFLYAARTGHAGVFLGRHAHLGATTLMTKADGIQRGGLDALLAHCLTPWVQANLYALPTPVAHLPDGPDKTVVAAETLWQTDLALIGGVPGAVAAFADTVRGRDEEDRPVIPHLQAVWPNLECFLHFGAPLGLFGETLRSALTSVNFHELYVAAEGVFAAQDDNHQPGLRLLTDAGIFHEFLPLAEYHETKLAQLGAHCVPLEKVKPGVDYIMFVTTPAGLCRCAVGDIVRFVSVNPPRLQFVGRSGLYLNPFGEQVTERELMETMLAVCARNGWRVVNFHVAPFQHRIAAGQEVRCHEWWLELHTHTLRTPTANVLGPEFDAELAMRNRDYASRRNDRTIHSPQVRLVMPGVFEQWAAQYHKTASASKMPRCHSTRLIADQLAALARFHPDTSTPFPRGE